MARRNTFRRLSLALAGAVVAALALAGCGSGHSADRPTPTPTTSRSATSKAPTSHPASTPRQSPATHPSTTKHTTHPPPPPAQPKANPPAAPVTHPPAPAAPPPAAGPPHVGAVPGGVTAIGDSVMIDAEPALKADIPGIYVDAAVSRGAGVGLQVEQSLAAQGRLARTVVIHMGTNGTFNAAQFDQYVAVAAGRHLIMITDHCPYCSWVAGNNAMLHAKCTAAVHCTIADWAALAARNGQWFGDDGVHMPIGGAGAQAYAQLVVQAL